MPALQPVAERETLGALQPLTAAWLRAQVLKLAAPSPALPLAVAVSGGADSLALLKLSAEAFAGKVQALTVDHGLRAESAREAAQVAAIARSLGVPHAILPPDAPIGQANVQAEAREARYLRLARHCREQGLAALLTAHHADDQAETLVMRLNRGSGLAGLAGIRARQFLHGCLVLRPLLSQRRCAVRALLCGTGWEVVADPSNEDGRFDRARARRLLAGTSGLDAARAAASAAHLADAHEALLWATERAWASRVSGRFHLDLEDLPPELCRQLLARAFHELGLEPRGGAIARLLARGGGTLAGVRVRVRANVWIVSPPG
ncbi:MAG: tRNA lysidine(34) synthetase TilS [Sphingomonadaceae bacterium]